MALTAFAMKIEKSVKPVGRVLFQHPLFSAALFGLVFTLGFAPFFWWPLALLALCGLVVLVHRSASVKSAFVLGFVFALCHHVSALYWMAKSFYISFGDWLIALSVGVPAVVFVSAALALFVALPCCLYKKGLALFKIQQAPLLFTSLFVGFELLRSCVVQVFPWNLSGYMWADNLYLMQFASVAGVFGLSFALVFTAALLAGGKAQRTFAPFVLVFMAVWGVVRLEYYAESTAVGDALAPKGPQVNAMAEVFRMAQGGAPTVVEPVASVGTEMPALPEVSFLLAQPNIDQRRKWNEDRLYALEWLVGASGNARRDVANNMPTITVWPETAVAYNLEGRENLRREITQFLEPSDVLITGGLNFEDDSTTGARFARNGMYALNANGGIIDSYYKEYLIPWGEYFPFIENLPNYIRELWGARIEFRSSGVGDDGLPRAQDTLIEIPLLSGAGNVHNLRLLPLICGEAVLPFLAQSRYALHGKRADAIVVVTNDAWFDGTVGPHQHYAMARLRAVELNLPMVRVANTGISAVVDAYGREVKRFNMKQRGVLKWDMR